ncbi:MAG: NAD(P)/FAD-dependent oxidoreductase, partial [Spirochaetota bacterium]
FLELSSRRGYGTVSAKAVVLAMGCRERPAGAISIPGTRPSGVYTAGSVQNMINLQNRMPGKRAVILGSGDIGLIMARRLTLEGASVAGCYEIQKYSNGLPRNVRQCLNDYDIPLHLSSTVIEIRGKEKLDSVVCARMENGRAVSGTEEVVPCDMLLLSVGLIPENELSRMAGIQLSPVTGGAVVNGRCMTSVDGIFACGNVLHVHDLVDFVSEEADYAGHAAALYAAGEIEKKSAVPVSAGAGVRYVMPQSVFSDTDTKLSLRVKDPSRDGWIVVKGDGKELVRKKAIRLHPAEMQRITLLSSKFAGISALEVSVQ